jgi:hypothetical protein
MSVLQIFLAVFFEFWTLLGKQEYKLNAFSPANIARIIQSYNDYGESLIFIRYFRGR